MCQRCLLAVEREADLRFLPHNHLPWLGFNVIVIKQSRPSATVLRKSACKTYGWMYKTDLVWESFDTLCSAVLPTASGTS